MSKCEKNGHEMWYMGERTRLCRVCGTPNLNHPQQRGYSMFSDRNGNTLSVKDMKKVGENP